MNDFGLLQSDEERTGMKAICSDDVVVLGNALCDYYDGIGDGWLYAMELIAKAGHEGCRKRLKEYATLDEGVRRCVQTDPNYKPQS